MFIEMSGKSHSPLGEYIQRQLSLRYTEDGRPWSVRELARKAQVSSGGLSVIMRGNAVPETATLEKIADALKVPFTELLAAAGLEIPAQPEVDRSAAYVALRLSQLPDWIREQAIDGTARLVDAYWGIAHNQTNGNGHEDAPTKSQGVESDDIDSSILSLSLTEEEREVMRQALELYLQHPQEDAMADKEQKKDDDTKAHKVAEFMLKVIRKDPDVAERAAKKAEGQRQQIALLGTS